MNIRQEISRFGARGESLVVFDEPNAKLVRYLDLTPESVKRKRNTGIPLPQAVVEYEERPLLYLIRDDALSSPAKSKRELVDGMVRTLACRGEGDFLAIVRLGELEVYPLTLSRARSKAFLINDDDARAPLLVSDLASGVTRLDAGADVPAAQVHANAAAIHRLLFKLMKEASEMLRESQVLSASREHDEVLPLIGRALFARFLIDRGIANPRTFSEIFLEAKPEDSFATPESAARTCLWLDVNFNGELLPLLTPRHPTFDEYKAFFEGVHSRSDRVLHGLSNIMYRAPGGSLLLDLDWAGIDFAHVPVGLLSEVYEDYSHTFYKDDALRESVRFTPKLIAEFTIDQAFQGLDGKERRSARVLDPACGAGIFLVLALQRLIAERWAVTGKRPETKDIREILNGQITGFDINRAALTLAALSLYLTALELDADPYPLDKLRFDPLLDRVLFNMREPHEAFPYDKHVKGSLGPLGEDPRHMGVYSIVLGNPPWTAWKGQAGKEINEYVTKTVRQLIDKASKTAGRSLVAKPYDHNDRLPDVAFLWRATQWAKPGGIIALIVHGRLLFKRADKGAEMRAALFQSVHVTGVLNGAELDALWPSLNQPFCIVFARNEVPQPNSRFRFVTPELDVGAGNRYRMRMDYDSAQSVDFASIVSRPFLLKALFRGGRLDVELIDRLSELTRPEEIEIDEDDDSPRPDVTEIPARAQAIGEFWGSGKDALASGQGYMPGPGKMPDEIIRLGGKALTTDDNAGLIVDAEKLSAFAEVSALRSRTSNIYLPPLMLLSEGFGETREDIRARLYIQDTPLIYNRSFYGFSTRGFPKAIHRDPALALRFKDRDAVALAKYLFVVANSDLFEYFMLQTSAKFGVERRTVFVEDVEAFPLIFLDNLSDKQFGEMIEIAEALNIGNPASWDRLNTWVNDLYEVTTADEQVMRDTVATRMPYEASEKRARVTGSSAEIECFVHSVQEILDPLYKATGKSLRIKHVHLPVSTWVAFNISSVMDTPPAPGDLIAQMATQLAENEGLSRIILRDGNGCLRIAVRNQYRYLTKTRARLCALDVLRECSDVFSSPVSA